MLGNTAAAMLRMPVLGPGRLRPIAIPMIGVMLGSSLTLDVLIRLPSWIPTLLIMPVFLLCAAGASMMIYRRFGGFDTVTAYYAAMPGGLNEMMLLGAAAGGDERRIALAHAARVLVTILFVALFFGLVLGVTTAGQSRAWIPLTAPSVIDYVILMTCAVAGVVLGQKIKLPAAPVFGPMILSGIAHVAGWITVAPPTLFVIVAQIIVGTVIGCRFAGASPRDVARDISMAVISTTAMLLIAVGFAEIIVATSGMAHSQAFLAYAPGGLTEMSLMSLTMGQDVAYVSMMHIVRITLVVASAPLVFRLLRRLGS